MKEENAEDGVRIERFFRPDPRVRQCRPATRKLHGRGSLEQGFRVAELQRLEDVPRSAALDQVTVFQRIPAANYRGSRAH
jgi:hypothetical protein